MLTVCIGCFLALASRARAARPKRQLLQLTKYSTVFKSFCLILQAVGTEIRLLGHAIELRPPKGEASASAAAASESLQETALMLASAVNVVQALRGATGRPPGSLQVVKIRDPAGFQGLPQPCVGPRCSAAMYLDMANHMLQPQ